MAYFVNMRRDTRRCPLNFLILLVSWCPIYTSRHIKPLGDTKGQNRPSAIILPDGRPILVSSPLAHGPGPFSAYWPDFWSIKDARLLPPGTTQHFQPITLLPTNFVEIDRTTCVDHCHMVLCQTLNFNSN